MGKTTIAAALGLLAAERGLRTIVVEVGEQEPAARRCSGCPSRRRRASRSQLRRAPVEHLDRPRPRAARVAAGARRARVRAACSPRAAPSSTSPPPPRARRSSSAWSRSGSSPRASAGSAARRRLRPGGPRRPRHRPRAGDAALAADVRGDRARRSDRRAVRRRCASCWRTRRAPAIWRSRRRPRWPSPRRSSCRTGCERELGRELDAVIVNGLLPRRFTAAELAARSPTACERTAPSAAAARLATQRRRARAQARRTTARAFSTTSSRACAAAPFEVLGVPFLFGAELDLDAVRRIAGAPARAASERLRGVRLGRSETVAAGGGVALEQPDGQQRRDVAVRGARVHVEHPRQLGDPQVARRPAESTRARAGPRAASATGAGRPSAPGSSTRSESSESVHSGSLSAESSTDIVPPWPAARTTWSTCALESSIVHVSPEPSSVRAERREGRPARCHWRDDAALGCHPSCLSSSAAHGAASLSLRA